MDISLDKPPEATHAESGHKRSFVDNRGQLEGRLHIDPDVERRVVRKIDLTLVPLVASLCGCSFSMATIRSG